MARRLGMLKSQGIKAIGEAGRPKREFAQVMGVSRGARPAPSGSRGGKQDQSAHRGTIHRLDPEFPARDRHATAKLLPPVSPNWCHPSAEFESKLVPPVS